MKIAATIYFISIVIVLLGIHDLKRFESVIHNSKQDRYYQFYNRMYIFMLLLYIVPIANTVIALIYIREYILNVYARIKAAYILWQLNKIIPDNDVKFKHQVRRRQLTDTDSQ